MISLAQTRKDLAFAAGLVQRKPFDCLLQVTNRCNMVCSFCDFWPNPAPKKEELTVEEYARIARELDGMGTFIVSIEGGEPMIRKDLIEIVRPFGRRHIPALFTNGWYVTRDNARALFDAGLVHASVSIDYPDAARHDAKRGLAGSTERAWRAVEMLRDAAPRGGKQVHVMTVVMEDNWRDLEALFRQSAARGVGQQLTLLSLSGPRRSTRGLALLPGQQGADATPPPEVAAHLLDLWARYPHVRYFRDYLAQMEPFLSGGSMPACRAGVQSFNIDHVGDVSPCIERIDEPVGNVRTDHLEDLHARLVGRQDEIAGCQRCWTACRGLSQAMGAGGTARSWIELAARMRTT